MAGLRDDQSQWKMMMQASNYSVTTVLKVPQRREQLQQATTVQDA